MDSIDHLSYENGGGYSQDGGMMQVDIDPARLSNNLTYSNNTAASYEYTHSNAGGEDEEVSAETHAPPNGHQYDTPPQNFVEAVTPSSSKKHGGLLRAASVGILPSIGQAVGQLSPNSRSRHIPTPVFTGFIESKQAGNQPYEFVPSGVNQMPSKAPSQGDAFSGKHLPTLDSPQNLFNPSSGNALFALPSHGLGQYRSVRNARPAMLSKSPIDTNPYAYRADEIGPTHGIPGIGHLGAMLVPPGWKEGDEPIPPYEAQRLYDSSRNIAARMLEEMRKEIETQPLEEQQKSKEERDQEWNKRFRLDDLVLHERIRIFDEYHQRKKLRNHQPKLGPPLSLPEMRSLSLPTMQPPASTSIPKYQHLPPSKMRRSSAAYFQLQEEGDGEHISVSSSSCYADPKSLDPVLLRQSVPAVYNRFQNGQLDLMKKKMEIEQQYGSFLAHYSGLTSGTKTPALPSPAPSSQAGSMAGFQAGPKVRNATPQAAELPRPLPYVSPTRARFGSWRNNIPGVLPQNQAVGGASRSFPVGPEAARAYTTDYSTGSYFVNNCGTATSNVSSGQQSFANMAPVQPQSKPVELVLDTSGASAKVVKPRKQRASRAKPLEAREQAWYSEEVKNADLPTSSISETAQKAGEEFASRQGTSIKPKAQGPVRRRGVAPDISKGFPITAKAADQLVKGGFMKHQDTLLARRAQPFQPASIAMSQAGPQAGQPLQYPYPSASASSATYVPSAVAMHAFANVPAAGSMPAALTNNNQSMAVNHEGSQLDSDSDLSDDSKDETFNTSNHKAVPVKQTAARGVKRKLTGNMPRGKRTRRGTSRTQNTRNAGQGEEAHSQSSLDD